jgi:SPP1 gp7 family putative phage head morphogenesis protein
LDQISAEVASLQAEPLRKLIPVLAEAERELATDLELVLASMKGGTYKAQMLRRALVQVRGSLNAIERVRPEMKAELTKAGRRAGQMANRHIMDELAAFSLRFGGTITPVPMLAASKALEKSLIHRFDSMSKRWSMQAKDEIRHQIALGLVRGEDIGQMTKRLTGKNIPGLTVKEGADYISKEIMRRNTAKAHRIVRTEVVNAYNEHALDQIEEVHALDPRIMKRWDATIDMRTCAYCRRLHEVAVHPKEMFPGGVDAPPLHPHCRCAVIVWRDDWDKTKDRSVAHVKLDGPPEE